MIRDVSCQWLSPKANHDQPITVTNHSPSLGRCHLLCVACFSALHMMRPGRSARWKSRANRSTVQFMTSGDWSEVMGTLVRPLPKIINHWLMERWCWLINPWRLEVGLTPKGYSPWLRMVKNTQEWSDTGRRPRRDVRADSQERSSQGTLRNDVKRELTLRGDVNRELRLKRWR